MNEIKPVLELRGVSKDFVVGNKTIPVLNAIDLKVYQNQIIGIIGPSGAGKSTLLHILGLLDVPTDGEVYLNGEQTILMKDRTRAYLRNQYLGFVFQFHHLLPEFNVWENVCIPGLIAQNNLSQIRETARGLLIQLGLEARLTHFPRQLSFGEVQRAAISRALINNPRVVLADEPTGNLDRVTGEEVKSLLWTQVKNRAGTLIFVTHDDKLVAGADRIIRLVDGKIKE